MNVKEYELTAFNQSMIRYTDEDSQNKNILYKLEGKISELTTGTFQLEDTGLFILQIKCTLMTLIRINKSVKLIIRKI